MTNSRRLIHSALLCIIAVTLTAGEALAHEFWISPSTYSPAANGLVRVSLFHGERFAGDVVARNDPMIKRFEYWADGSVTDVLGRHGTATSYMRPDGVGHAVVVYETEEYINPLPAEEFEAYLLEEGLDEIRERRAALGESGTEGREAYVRCAKSLLTVGDAGPFTGETEAVGLPLEIVIERIENSADGVLEARLLFEGEPLAGRRVVATSENNPGALVELKADSSGMVRFVPDEGGPWILTALHMERVTDRDDIDWKSYWASTTFAVPERMQAGEGTRLGGGA